MNQNVENQWKDIERGKTEVGGEESAPGSHNSVYHKSIDTALGPNAILFSNLSDDRSNASSKKFPPHSAI
jgi:hypothetical protein